MRILSRLLVLFITAYLVTTPMELRAEDTQVNEIKTQILLLAQSYSGQGDPDFSKQYALDTLVNKLLIAVPQPPLQERLPLLYGTWKQVWGPYDYRNKDRGVDPKLEVNEIYQTVFSGGYYYNVSPLYEDGDRSKIRIGLLRGEYESDETLPNRINVHFTRYPGIKGRPTHDIPIWRLATLAETNQLSDQITIVPRWIIWLFFNTGSLDEVYTDHDLRICYGSDGTESGVRSLYVMTRVE